MKVEPFGTTKSGEAVNLFSLENQNGMVARVTNYGGIVTHLLVPDVKGQKTDVVLGFDTLEPYLGEHPYFGAITGRVAGRTTGGRFTLGSQTYELAINDGPNHLHGGLVGFDKRVWAAETLIVEGNDVLKLAYTSPDGEEGYPGNLEVIVTYTLNQENELVMEYEATTDKTTPICLTNHSYFNLKGSSHALDHQVQIMSSHVTLGDEDCTLDDAKKSLEGHPEDFREPVPLKDRIADIALEHGCHHWLDLKKKGAYAHVGTLSHEGSGIVMKVSSDSPCMQFYTGKFLDGTLPAKWGGNYESFDGICMECQDYPNGSNAVEFASNLLHPGEVYRQKTAYAFEVSR